MGVCASKKVEQKLKGSLLFHAAVATSFEECLAISQHTAPGIFLYQLLAASHRVYHLIPSFDSVAEDHDEDPAPLLKQRWLPSPPSQANVDRALRQHNLLSPAGKQFLSSEEFRVFSFSLFGDMILASGEHRMAVLLPVGSAAVLIVHLIAGRVPALAYRPAVLLGSVLGAAATLGMHIS